MGGSDPCLRSAATQNWWEDVEGLVGSEYSDAVAWCLGSSRIKANDKASRKELYERGDHSAAAEVLRGH